MRTRVVSTVLWLALAGILALSGCAKQPPATLELTQADSGSSQTLEVGQELRITAESNPTTGYRWAVDGQPPAQLEQVGEPAYAPVSSALGAGGVETWVFKAASVGTGTLKLKYWRSFEPTASPENRFEVKVDVR